MLKIFLLFITSTTLPAYTEAEKLQNEDFRANIIVTMATDTSDILSSISSRSFLSRGYRLTAVTKALRDHAMGSQRSVLEFLNKEGISFESFWISNQILVRQASKLLVERLLQFDSIREITEELVISLEEPIYEEDLETQQQINGIQWGVAKIEADRVWAEGITGKGVTVGGIDTGVRGTHESLAGNYLGVYGWFDPENQEANSSSVYDTIGHGTHTMGTIVGANGIGVAPGAKWMACRGCILPRVCTQGHLIACGEFMLCPTLPDKSNPDCTKAPHIVSNSWAGGQGETFYNRVIHAWRAGGIIPVFSQGNDGPNCGTANSPGDNEEVIGVGSTTWRDKLSSSSSVGPTVDGKRIKPDISAPGSNVYSAYHTSDTAYETLSGTSMACPHTAGAVALILSARRQATFSEVTKALYGGAETNVSSTGKNCGNVNESRFPNNAFGHGRLNVNKAILSM